MACKQSRCEFWAKVELPGHRFLTIPLVPLLDPLSRAWSMLFLPPQTLPDIGEIPSVSPLEAEQSQLPQPFLVTEMLQSFSIFTASTGPTPGAPRPSCPEEPTTGHSTPDVPH
ncbi:hypothetical protein WISP_07725 [Willisornis vidua]|uniref:Uncharacterized protein n=1 Tax=Willisornis vidua TaxID=1566151 RepID=A0ABQ9DSJ3_9PASS|nr:hypothetical protein WISP_07725 [Willisornis vidua]